MPPKGSKGNTKLNIDKQAWKWAETTDPAEVTVEHLKLAYRLGLKRCEHTGQRRNCKGNPQCLIGLGEKEWLGEIADENWHDIEDPENERREKNLFVGLKNLGATCYVNSLLQVWFHNPIFRAAIYKYSEEPGAVPEEGGTSEPKTICGHLQLVFGLLEKSIRRYIDPSDFINSLGLNTTQQQDAQEFSKLFIALLEDTLRMQRHPQVKNVVQELFSGEYAYCTRCTKCSQVSKRPSKFYELDLNIKGHKDLNQCLLEFLQEEKLEGDNQYMCQGCNSKQNAGRKIQLTRLPQVLNLQLLRFVFDRNTGQKKKLNTCIQFPEEIDMRQYMDDSTDNTDECKYELKAVLIHRGPTAYSGHYIAHIKDKKNGAWYKFNDEEVEKMKGSNLQLGNEEEIELNPDKETKAPKKPRLAKGTHASKNAYMLVYYKKTEEKEDSSDLVGLDLPVKIQDYVAKDNIKFEDWCKEMLEMRAHNVASGKAKQAEVTKMYQMIQPHEESVSEWITVEWLSKWLADFENTPEIDNSILLCGHQKLNPDIINKMKCINTQGAELLYSKYSGGPRLPNDMLCMTCVRERCRVIRLKARVAEDSLFMTQALKNFTPEGTCYWVGKASLRSWKKMALDQLNTMETNGNSDQNTDAEPSMDTEAQSSSVEDSLNSKQEEQTSCSEQEQTNSSCKQEEQTSSSSHDDKENHDVEREDFSFNEDILCEPHRKLCIDVGDRRLVSEEVWKRLKSYFPEASEFLETTEACQECTNQARRDIEARENSKTLAMEQRQSLSDLYHGKGRPKLYTSETELYIVNNIFLEAWRKYLRNPARCEPITQLNNCLLVCDHGRTFVQPDTIHLCDPGDSNAVTLLRPPEWETLIRYVDVDKTLTVLPVKEEGGKTVLIMSPEVCDECVALRMHLANCDKMDYKNAKIYVQKLSPGAELEMGTEEGNASSHSSDFEDPELSEAGRKKRKKSPVNVEEIEVPAKMSKSTNGQIRRSTRHRKVRGEKVVQVDSSDTLRDLKVQLMKLFSVAPFDQHLTLNGRILLDDKATISSLGVMPESVLKMKVDEPVDGAAYLLEDSITVSSGPEEGFKGTGLLLGR